jgi:transposase
MSQRIPKFRNEEERQTFWFEIVKNFYPSGLSADKYAQKYDVSGTSVHRWAKKYEASLAKNQSENQLKEDQSATFLPVGGNYSAIRS